MDNNLNLALDFLKKCQKCEKSGVPKDNAILAALQDLANYKDQHPKGELWSKEKVIEWIRNNFYCSGHGFPLHYSHVSYQPEDIIRDLCKEMES